MRSPVTRWRGARNERPVSATRDYMAVGAVECEPVSAANSLIYREDTGKPFESGACGWPGFSDRQRVGRPTRRVSLKWGTGNHPLMSRDSESPRRAVEATSSSVVANGAAAPSDRRPSISIASAEAGHRPIELDPAAPAADEPCVGGSRYSSPPSARNLST
jgi:hypothetical protein